MAHKFYQYTLQGEHALPAIHAALGAVLSEAVIVRTHTHGGQTTVHVASRSHKAPPAAGTAQAVEVSERDVLKH